MFPQDEASALPSAAKIARWRATARRLRSGVPSSPCQGTPLSGRSWRSPSDAENSSVSRPRAARLVSRGSSAEFIAEPQIDVFDHCLSAREHNDGHGSSREPLGSEWIAVIRLG